MYRRDLVRRGLLFLAITALPSSVLRAQPTMGDFADAILETRPISAAELLELDLNGDGVVDPRDVVLFKISFTSDCAAVPPVNCPELSFLASDSTVVEGAGSIGVPVVLSVPLSLELRFRVVDLDPDSGMPVGTALRGTDFEWSPTAGDLAALSVAGGGADLPLDILEDGELDEGVETLVLELLPGTGYQLGAVQRHVLSIVDNDRVWRGVLETTEGRLDLRFDFIQSTTGLDGRLVSLGNGSFPAGEFDLIVESSPNRFVATTEPIRMAASDTAFGVPLERTLSFVADAADADQDVQSNGIAGAFLDTLRSPGNPHLEHVTEGTFLVADVPLAPAAVEAQLFDAR
ncbi:MAG: hypothetical protein AAF533_08950 [Acidobacteriota bacterium]